MGDKVKAFYWYKRAAENGDSKAKYNLGTCYFNGIEIGKDETKAFYWYQKAAEEINDARYKLGYFYEIGKGVEKDLEKSIYWFKRAESGCLNSTEWIKNALKYERVKFIPHVELDNAILLHAGGFGQITKAVWSKINNYVICKKLTNTIDIENDLLDTFVHELKMRLHLNYSDRFIHCFGISLDQNTNEYLLIMQYANGGDLQDYLKNNFKNFTWNDKKKLAFQIADGLNYLHNENVLHRDLNSKSIVIHENNAKIADFGISKSSYNRISTAHIDNFGVIAYMEPQRILDPKFPYTKSSDIYSFGVIMWEISSGYPPFKIGDNKIALAVSINTGVHEVVIPDTPKEYEKLYKNCWNREPEQRPTIKEVLDEFEGMGFGINVVNKLIKDIIYTLICTIKLTDSLRAKSFSKRFTVILIR
ncbi:unnamed protein product [Rhizophagus irregularis]|nr:unnamed protein product [Rhizophagus irregularis]